MIEIKLIPFLKHRLQYTPHSMSDINKIDDTMRHYIKCAHDCPPYIPNKVLYTSRGFGLLGVRKIEWAMHGRMAFMQLYYLKWSHSVCNPVCVQL